MITVVINGQSFDYPEVGDTDWGNAATVAFQSLAATTLQKDAGAFTLENELDFGGNYGVKVLFISSRSNDPALSGVFRLSKGELVAWRNEDNDGDNTITFDADGDLLVNGTKVTLHGQIVNDDVAAAAGIEESKLALDYSTDSLHTAIDNHVNDTNNPHSVTKAQVLTGDLIVNSDVDASAAIAESKLDLDYSTDSLNTTITNHISDTANPHSVTKAQVLTGDLIVNADVDASAAIAESKLDLDYSTDSLNTAITNHTSDTNNPHSTSVSNLTDTTISTPTSGDVLGYDGSKWVNQPSTSSSLSGLSDTDITTPADGDVLVYDSVSTKWENSDALTTVSTNLSTHTSNTSNPHSTSVSNLTDTTITTPSDQDTVVYDNVSSKWINQANTIDNLKNTTITTPSSGDALSYNGSVWVNKEDSLTNLTDTTITTPSDQDTIVYDNNSSKWINQSNTIGNVKDVNIQNATVDDVLVYDDVNQEWVNSQVMINHIGNAANPHLTTVSKLTDTTITTPSDKQLLQYDYANLQWVNSSDVWTQIEVNDIANINTAVTDVTLTASDKRHQIFTASNGFNITLPSTGIKAGEKFVFDFSTLVNYFSTPFVFYVGAVPIYYCYNGFFRYILIATANTPTSSDWKLLTVKTEELILHGEYNNDSFLIENNSRNTASSSTIYTLTPGVWDVSLSFGINGGTVSTGAWWFYAINSNGGLIVGYDSEAVGSVIQTSIQNSRPTASFTLNGVLVTGSMMQGNTINKLANVTTSSINVSLGASIATAGATETVRLIERSTARLVQPRIIALS